MKFEGFSTENRHIAKNIPTSADTLISDVFISKSDRLLTYGGGITSSNLLPVYFAALIGAPIADKETEFSNSLCQLREKLAASAKFMIFIQNELKAPTPQEMSFFDAVTRGNPDETVADLINLINISGDTQRTDEAKRIFEELIEPYKALPPEELFSYGARTVTWLNRCVMSQAYRNACTSDIPIILYYGYIGKNEATFLHFMSRIGIDVLVLCSDKKILPLLSDDNPENRMQIFELPESKAVTPYPDKLVKTKYATVAYSAERELDTFLYGDRTIFRDFQFSRMQSLTLKTTYEEIDILWHQPAKYRSGFNVIDNKCAVIPNIFAKISGVKDGDLDYYWECVRSKLSPFVRLMNKAPTYDKYSPSQFNVFLPYYRGKKIDIEKLKKSPFNKYGFLSDTIQNLVFDKMQEAIISGLLMLDDNEITPLVIYVGLNIDKEILKILQKFDFTKDIPKLIITDVIEDTFSKVECIQLVLFNLMGFDIIVYTPTGYRNLETYISENAFETYTMNDFQYNVRVPKLKIPDAIPEPKSEGFFSKLFKKGR